MRPCQIGSNWRDLRICSATSEGCTPRAEESKEESSARVKKSLVMREAERETERERERAEKKS